MGEIAAVATIVGRCGSAIALIHKVSEKYNLANSTLASISTECSVIEIALRRVEGLASSPHLSKLETNSDLHDGFNTALNGCSTTLQAVSTEVERIGGSEMGHRREPSWKMALPSMAKIKFVINDRRLKELLDQLRGQHHALQLLLQAYATESMKELSTIMANIRPFLRKIDDDASSMQVSRDPFADPSESGSRRGRRDYVRSIISYGDLMSEISSTQLTIDEALINTNVYRRQLAALTARSGSRFKQLPPKPLPDIVIPDSSTPDIPDIDSIIAGFDSLQDFQLSPLTDRDAIDDPPPPLPEKQTNSYKESDTSTVTERSILTPSEPTSSTQRIQFLGNEDDYLIAHKALERNRHDPGGLVRMLEELRKLGTPTDYSRGLKALESSGANFTLTLKYLKYLRSFGLMSDYSYALETLEVHGYKFAEVKDKLEVIRKIAQSCDNYSLALQLLRHLEYNLDATTRKLQSLKVVSPEIEDYSRVLILLQYSQFSTKKTLKLLDQMLSFTRRIARQSLIGATDLSSLPYSLALLEKNQYNAEQTINDLTSLQGLGRDWKDFIALQKVLARNKFDLKQTTDDISWLTSIIDGRSSLASVLDMNDHDLRNIRQYFDKISTLGTIGDFFWSMKALEKNDFDFKRTLTLLDHIHRLTEGTADYTFILEISDHLGWRESRINLVFGLTSQSSIMALSLIRKNKQDASEWFKQLAGFTRSAEKRFEDALCSLGYLQYDFSVTMHFVSQVKDPLGCGGKSFMTSLAIFQSLQGEPVDKVEVVLIMNALRLYEADQKHVKFIFSNLMYDSKPIRELFYNLYTINGPLEKAKRTALWLLQYYVDFQEFMHLIRALSTRWTTREDRRICLDFLETLNGDYKQAERTIDSLQTHEHESSRGRPESPERALAALKRNGYKEDCTLTEWDRLHAINPQSTHWDYVLRIYSQCSFDIEHTITQLKRLNDEHDGDPFWYDLLVVNGTHTVPKSPEDKFDASMVISHFNAMYECIEHQVKQRNRGVVATRFASVVQDHSKGFY
ncbi:hypothetical protein CPB86DRAFT_490713 [Serendipita vermifera]|nr:hypothetical protein CPB86DRAFT_490713 [Serendipita vermifera]